MARVTKKPQPQVSVEQQRAIFERAVALGWPGTVPPVMGTYSTDGALKQAQAFIDSHAQDQI